MRKLNIRDFDDLNRNQEYVLNYSIIRKNSSLHIRHLDTSDLVRGTNLNLIIRKQNKGQ